MISHTNYPNVFFIIPAETKFDSLLEINNINLILDEIDKNHKEWFIETCFVFNWCFDDEIENDQIKKYKRKVLLRIGEQHPQKITQKVSEYFNIVFQNYLLEDNPDMRYYSLPLIVPQKEVARNIIPLNDRRYNVFYSGNFNKNRVPMYFALKNKASFLEKIWLRLSFIPFWHNLNKRFHKNKVIDLSSHYLQSIIKFNFSFYTGGYSHEEYERITSNSKIVFSPKGWKFAECFRTYEAMSHGCIVISEPLPNVPFYKDIPLIQLSDWKRIDEVVHGLLSDKPKMVKLSAEAYDFWNKRLSNVAISNYIYERSNFD